MVSFSPAPLGDDLFARFGGDFALPVVGNFDPPVTASPGSESADEEVSPGNDRDPFDLNDDGYVSPLDALLIINALEALQGAENELADQAMYDVNLDGVISPLDALLVINRLSP